MRRLTEAQRAWLTKLCDGPAKRGRGPVGFTCMRHGWTEWDYRVAGEPVSVEAAKARFGDLWFEHVDRGRDERITPAGREALRKEGGE